jgi:hypothetical protein
MNTPDLITAAIAAGIVWLWLRSRQKCAALRDERDDLRVELSEARGELRLRARWFDRLERLEDIA